MNNISLIILALILAFGSVSRALPDQPVDEQSECTSPKVKQSFIKRMLQDRGKIWLDLYPAEHGCLAVLNQSKAWNRLVAYNQIEKDDRDLLPDRINALATLRNALVEQKREITTSSVGKNIEELNYMLERVDEKTEHLQSLDEFLRRAAKVKSAEALVRPSGLSIELLPLAGVAQYSMEIIFHLDPGLRHAQMENSWKRFIRVTSERNNLVNIPKFYLWLEKQRNINFPLAEEDFRDNGSVKVFSQGQTFATLKYGSFNDLQNIDPDATEDDAEIFLYVLSENDELFIAQNKDLSMHSLFLHGAPVKGAGMLSISDGKINYINKMSGHYKPSEEHLNNTVKIINRRYPGIFSENVKVDRALKGKIE